MEAGKQSKLLMSVVKETPDVVKAVIMQMHARARLTESPMEANVDDFSVLQQPQDRYIITASFPHFIHSELQKQTFYYSSQKKSEIADKFKIFSWHLLIAKIHFSII